MHFNPLHVVAMDSDITYTRSSHTTVHTVSLSRHKALTWSAGHIRGGTPAHLINENEYLTIFHSTTAVKGYSGRITFFMGAITFTARPPFEIVRISSAPIISDGDHLFYSGPWFQKKYDYIVYPTGYVFMLEDPSGRKRVANELSDLYLYDGSSNHTRDDNYCESTDRGNVTLIISYGRQDMNAWVSHINLCDLLSTMEYVS
jgi:hypothetical protein